jgi:hypothetical protein
MACTGSGSPIPPAYFGSLQDLVRSEYEASTGYLEDQANWSRNLPSASDRIIGYPEPRASVIRIGLLRRIQ